MAAAFHNNWVNVYSPLHGLEQQCVLLFTLLIKKYVNNYFKLLYKWMTRNNISLFFWQFESVNINFSTATARGRNEECLTTCRIRDTKTNDFWSFCRIFTFLKSHSWGSWKYETSQIIRTKRSTSYFLHLSFALSMKHFSRYFM